VDKTEIEVKARRQAVLSEIKTDVEHLEKEIKHMEESLINK
jgi:hypothetical protein